MRTDWEKIEQLQDGVRFLAIVGIILSAGALFFGFIGLANTQAPWILLGGLVIAGIFWWRFYRRLKAYKESYKGYVVHKAAEGMFDRYEYYPQHGFQSEEIRATGIMAMGNRYNSEDMIEGVYKGVDFRRADMYIAQHVQSGKSSYTIEYLRGEWLTFTYNKNFVSDLQIRTKGFRYANTKTSRLFTSADVRRHEFETESTEFNKAFECTCQDDTEAFYLLTPRVMEMLLLLRDEFRCDFMVGFVHNRLHFAINSGKNNMEPPVFRSTSFEYEMEMVRRELKIITNIVDSLAIDRKLFVE